MEERDPFLLDPEKQDKFQNELKGKTVNVFCPKKNFGDPCKVCEVVSQLFNKNTEDARDIAFKKMAKAKNRTITPTLIVKMGSIIDVRFLTA